MRYLLPLLLLISAQGFAQCKEYMIGVNGDTLNCRDAKGLQQGPWIIKMENIRGERGYEEQGYYENGKRTGKWPAFRWKATCWPLKITAGATSMVKMCTSATWAIRCVKKAGAP